DARRTRAARPPARSLGRMERARRARPWHYDRHAERHARGRLRSAQRRRRDRLLMLVLQLLAERKIEEAITRGEFDDLPGAGRPLELDDDPLVPEDQRVAYRILKNAGYVPPEVQTLKEIADLERYTARDDLDADAIAKG